MKATYSLHLHEFKNTQQSTRFLIQATLQACEPCWYFETARAPENRQDHRPKRYFKVRMKIIIFIKYQILNEKVIVKKSICESFVFNIKQLFFIHIRSNAMWSIWVSKRTNLTNSRQICSCSFFMIGYLSGFTVKYRN